MRILRLDLLAFGPFTGQSLMFEEGPCGLHVIYGPNEAGKSSTLRAVRQWLYGIPHNKCNDDFVHTPQSLRIGGMLEGANGERIECVRRKGLKKTLRGTDDSEVLDESVLNGMLSGVDGMMFAQRFGIDYEELRRGGEAVVRGEGGLGEILFAAGTGLADLGQIQKQLDHDASELFTARGSVKPINKAVSELTAARRAVKDAQLSTSEWVRHDKALRAATQRQMEIDQELLEKRTRQNRLERVKKALPLIAQRNRLLEEFGEVADVPLLPDGFAEIRSKTLADFANAQQAEREASRAIENLRESIAELQVPTGLLEHRTAITQRHTELGGYQKAAKDRPVLSARLENTQVQAQRILEELGREPEIEQAERLRLNRTQRQRIQSLANDCKARFDAQKLADQAVSKLRGEIKRVEFELAELPTTKDTTELKRAIRRAQKHGDLDQQLAELRADMDDLKEQAMVDLNRLRLWNGTLEQLERLPVPAVETIDHFETALAAAGTNVARIEERIDEMTQQTQELDQRLEKLRLEQDVPTEEDLTQARRQRDAGWRFVQQSWLSGLPTDDPSIIEFIEEHAPAADLAQAFQVCIGAADAVVDRLRREAARVAEKASLTANRQDLDRRLSDQQRQLVTAQKECERLQSQWHAQWLQSDIVPLSPREMRSWLRQQQALTSAAEDIRKKRNSLDANDALFQSLSEKLCECLQSLDLPTAEECKTLAQVLEHSEAIAAEIESTERQRQEYERELQNLRDRLAHAEQEAVQAECELEQWRQEWEKAVALIGLDRDAQPSEAVLVIDSVNELFELLKQAGELGDRVDGIDRDANEFKIGVQHLLSQIANDLKDFPVDQAIADLYDRLESASTAQTKLNGWNERLKGEESKRDNAHSMVEHLEATVQLLCEQAGCASADGLPAAEARSAQRRDLERDLKSVNEQLEMLAAGSPLERFISEAEPFDSDEVQAELQRLSESVDELDAEKSKMLEAIGSHRRDLQRMDGSGQAAEAQEQAQHLLARIRADAEQYIRLRLASAVLRRSIERFRDMNQEPVLALASDLFADLTLGSFDALRADYDDKGHAILVGVRPGRGQTVGVEGMSDGTRDQLYLALRLALLESYLEEREPLPFIVDDLLIMFDDDRAVAALKALARLSEKTQVIFFTHHEHLVRLASQNLDDSALSVHTLDYREGASLRTAKTELGV